MLSQTLAGRATARGRALAVATVPAALTPLLLAVAVVLALGLPTLLFPFGPDQAIFAYIAHTIRHGGFPYVDAWDQKPPAIYLIYAVALGFPGALMRDVRLFDLCATMAAMGAIYLLGRLLWGRWAGGLAALLFGTAYVTEYGYWHTAQPDGYTALPMALALWLYYRSLPRMRPWPYLLAGLLTGFAFQLRFFTALLGLALLVIEAHRLPGPVRRCWRGPALRVGWFSAGFLLMQTLFALYLLAGHALGAYLYTELRFATGYAHLGGAYSPNGFRWDLYFDALRGNTLLFLFSHLFISAPAALALGLAAGRAGDRRARELGLVLLLAYLGVLIQAKFFWYHWLAVLPWLALLGGLGLQQTANWLGARRSRPAAVGGVAIVLTLLVLLTPPVTEHAIGQWQGVSDYFGGQTRRHAYNNQFGPYNGGPFSYLADDEVGRYLQQRTRPGDTIYVYGYEHLVYLLSGRDSASRFFYVFPTISTWAPPAWHDELIRDLTAKRPRYILIEANEGAPWITGLREDTAHYAAHDAPLQALLAARYQRERQIEDFTLYRLH